MSIPKALAIAAALVATLTTANAQTYIPPANMDLPSKQLLEGMAWTGICMTVAPSSVSKEEAWGYRELLATRVAKGLVTAKANEIFAEVMKDVKTVNDGYAARGSSVRTTLAEQLSPMCQGQDGLMRRLGSK
jgi:hypothetical protein